MMLLRKASAPLGAALLLGLAGVAHAQPAQPSLKALGDCRKITANAERLACYDEVAGRLEVAERSGDLVVVNRGQAEAARRQAFGFNLPALNIFGRGESDGALKQASFTLARAVQDGRGKWVLHTTEGQVWRQIDTERLRRDPRANSRMEVNRAALGSYLVSIDGQRSIRAVREQ